MSILTAKHEMMNKKTKKHLKQFKLKTFSFYHEDMFKKEFKSSESIFSRVF